MSVNSKARKATSIEDLLYEYKRENQLLHALLRDRKGFSASETKPIGTSGGISGSGGSSGFLKTEGDTMIGPIAFFPDLVIRDAVDDSINISKDAAQAFSSRIIVSVGVSQEDISLIHGAAFAGQLLILQGILTESFVIKHGLGNIRTFTGEDIEVIDNQNIWLVFDSIANEWAAIGGSGSGGGTGLHISADLVADQTANLAVNDHIEFDRNAPPTGIDGGIVLQTGAGQANGIFELKAEKTYFLSAAASPIKSASTQLVMAWYDITNGNEIGRRTLYDESNAAFRDNQPKAEIIFTPATDVNVEFRIIAITTPANLTGFFAITTYAHIMEFSGRNGADGAQGVAGSINWKDSVRAKTLIDVPGLAAFTVLTDGVTLVENDRVLLTEQTIPLENGIYDVGIVAAGLAPLTRSSDLNVSAELVASLFVAVEEGTTEKNTLWQLTSNNPLTIGVSDQVWTEFTQGSGSLGPGGEDGKDASGTFILDGRTGIGAANMEKIELFWPIKAPRDFQGDMILIEQEQYDHGDFGGGATEATNPNPVLVIVGHSGVLGGLAHPTSSRSTNYGESWTVLQDLTADKNWRNLAYDPTGKVLITSTGSLLGRSLLKGFDFAVTTESWSVQDCIWVERLSLFVLLDTGTGTNVIWTSPDGATGNWTQRTTPAAAVIPPTLFTGFDSLRDAPGLGKIYAFGNICTNTITSVDGITWVSENLLSIEDGVSGGWAFADPPRILTWNEGARRFITYDSSINKDLATEGYWLSAVGDPLTWTHHFIPSAGQAGTMAVQESASMWIVACHSNVEAKQPFHVSFDGENWTAVPTGFLRRQDYDEEELASDSLKQPKFPVVSKNFGYIMANGWNTRTQDDLYIWNMFYRTEVYFNALLPETSFRDRLNPR